MFNDDELKIIGALIAEAKWGSGRAKEHMIADIALSKIQKHFQEQKPVEEEK